MSFSEEASFIKFGYNYKDIVMNLELHNEELRRLYIRFSVCPSPTFNFLPPPL